MARTSLVGKEKKVIGVRFLESQLAEIITASYFGFDDLSKYIRALVAADIKKRKRKSDEKE